MVALVAFQQLEYVIQLHRSVIQASGRCYELAHTTERKEGRSTCRRGCHDFDNALYSGRLEVNFISCGVDGAGTGSAGFYGGARDLR